MRATHNIVLASNNRHKLEEFRALFKNYEDVVVLPARDFIRNSDKLALLEKDESYLENAIIKARHGNSASHYPCLGDDSGLEISALDGKPGVRSARYAPTQVGLSQDQANLEKVLEELKGHPMNQRSARMICHLALVIEGILVTADGVLEGTIAEAPQGSNGFGYDPIFIPKDSDQTLAEMTDEEKNKISHRFRALTGLMKQMVERGITLAKP